MQEVSAPQFRDDTPVSGPAETESSEPSEDAEHDYFSAPPSDVPEEDASNTNLTDLDAVTYDPQLWRSKCVSRPPERFDAALITHCLLSGADDPMT